jgi:D-alanyl-D-alanine carboxypeptidase
MFQLARFRICVAALLAAGLAACSETTAPQSMPETETVAPAPGAENTTRTAETVAVGLQAFVDGARERHDLVAVGAVIASSEEILETAVAGVRNAKTQDLVQLTDRWHLGSNTKALTALLYARLVERGHAERGAALPELFPDLAADMDPAWDNITIEELFAHRSGLKQIGGFWLIARRNDERPVSQQLAETARAALIEPPSRDPAKFDYNNLNYILAGAAIEGILREHDDLPDTWDAAMQALLFETLDDPSLKQEFGFGPPPAGLEGHRSFFGAFPSAVGRDKNADNPAVLGPAGTLHASLNAHAALAMEFLRADSTLIPRAMREKLTTPHPDADGDYAMGWGIYDDPKYGRVYLHFGSNTVWLSRIVVAPALDRLIIVNVNQYSDAAQSAVREITIAAFDEAIEAQAPQ